MRWRIWAAGSRSAAGPLGSRMHTTTSCWRQTCFPRTRPARLIVIEREIGLRTYIESGVPLDARLSYDLLATIFRPSAPLARWSGHRAEETVLRPRPAFCRCR